MVETEFEGPVDDFSPTADEVLAIDDENGSISPAAFDETKGAIAGLCYLPRPSSPRPLLYPGSASQFQFRSDDPEQTEILHASAPTLSRPPSSSRSNSLSRSILNGQRPSFNRPPSLSRRASFNPFSTNESHRLDLQKLGEALDLVLEELDFWFSVSAGQERDEEFWDFAQFCCASLTRLCHPEGFI